MPSNPARPLSTGWPGIATRPPLSLAKGGSLLAIVGLLAPFALILNASIMTPQQFVTDSVFSVPSPLTLENFIALLGAERSISGPIGRTVLVAMILILTQIPVSLLAAYTFARLKFRFRQGLFWAVVGLWAIPPIVTALPLYLMMVRWGLSGGIWGIVLPVALLSPYALFLLRQHILDIPEQYFDQALMDGAGHIRIIRSIIIPMSGPILFFLCCVTVVTQWNWFLWPRIVAGTQYQLVTVFIQSLNTQHQSNWTLVMAATLIVALPLLGSVIIANGITRFAAGQDESKAHL